MIQIHQLPASTTIADADMIPFDTGSVNKYITAANLLKQQSMVVLSSSQDVTVSIDALTVGRSYACRLNAYGNQTTCGVPENENYSVMAFCTTTQHKIIIIFGVSSGNVWLKRNASGTWSKWYMVSGKRTYAPTAGSLMASGGTAYRAGSMMTWEIGAKVNTSGTLTSSDYFGRIEGLKVPNTIHAFCAIGSDHALMRVVNNNNGIELRNNNTTTTLTANQYVIGSITFPVEEV